MKPQPVHIDAILYIGIAIFGFVETQLSSDEAGKFIALWLLFYLKCTNGSLLAGCTALKMYRSSSYADYVKEKKANGDTQHFVNPNPSQTIGKT